MRHPHDHDHNCNLPNVIGRPLPDNWPFGRPHRHPMDDFHEHFLSGFDPKVPSNGTVVSDVIDSIRTAKIAFNSTHSVPAVFARDVQDGDIVIPIPCIQEGNTACNELMDALFRMRRIPDAIWVPAFRKTLDEEVAALSDIDFDSYKPAFYGVAYVHIGRVMIGPVVAHPRYKFHTGSKLYAADNGDLTTENTGTLVGVCLAPGSFYLAPYASTLKQLFEDYYDQTIKDVVNKIENEGVDAGNVTVTVPGTVTDRPLANRFGDVVNIKDFGAVGDGVTNNTKAVNTAVTYANKLSGPACLFIPVGTYLVDAIPNIPCYGPGSLKTTAKAYGAFELLFKINGAIQKDTNGRFTVNLDQLSVDDLKKLIKSMLPETGGGLTTDEDGKLVIDFSQMTPAELMVILKQLISPNGGLIVGDDNKLAVDFKDLSKEDLEEIIKGMLPESGGGFGTDENGKLVINFENLTKEEFLTLTTVLIQEGGGLAIDKNGKIYVDFDKMDTTKFENMLKALKLPLWLEKPLTIYVSLTGSDVLEDGRGLSKSKPFRTLTAALYYVASTYNINKYDLTIQMLDGDYGRNNTVLPAYNTTSGIIIIKGNDTSRDNVKIGLININKAANYRLVNITCKPKDASVSTAGLIIEAGIVETQNVLVDLTETVSDSTKNRLGTNVTGGVLLVPATDTGVENGLYFSTSPDKEPTSFLNANGGSIELQADITILTSAKPSVAFAVAERGGSILFNRSVRNNPGRLPRVNLADDVVITGTRYKVQSNGIIDTASSGPDVFPGNASGEASSGGQYT